MLAYALNLQPSQPQAKEPAARLLPNSASNLPSLTTSQVQRSQTVNKASELHRSGKPLKRVHDSLIFEKMLQDKMRKLGPLEQSSTEFRNAAFKRNNFLHRTAADNFAHMPRSFNSSFDEQGTLYRQNMSTSASGKPVALNSRTDTDAYETTGISLKKLTVNEQVFNQGALADCTAKTATKRKNGDLEPLNLTTTARTNNTKQGGVCPSTTTTTPSRQYLNHSYGGKAPPYSTKNVVSKPFKMPRIKPVMGKYSNIVERQYNMLLTSDSIFNTENGGQEHQTVFFIPGRTSRRQVSSQHLASAVMNNTAS